MTIDPLVFTSLIMACTLQAFIIALLAAAMPAFVWRMFKLEGRVDQAEKNLAAVDEVVAEMNKAMMGPPMGGKP